MSTIAIRVENLSKRYRIAGQRARYKTFRETLSNAARSSLGRFSKFIKGESTIDNQQLNNTIWALENVSFEVMHDDVLGIIGRNGAGKSTLLKVLSRITKPTKGRAEVHGRMGTLLEVGTGFHPELTGRENIFLNGAILGMRKAEINRNFDEIVSFAEVEKFIETPVKYYSTGMYMRLAFSVAAHLEPEILVIDEVLAVGDPAFQKKCLGKMGDVARQGRTVLFVSHNMSAIQALCNKTILLDKGKLLEMGSTTNVIQQYYKLMGTTDSIPISDRRDRMGNGSVRICSFNIDPFDDELVINSSSRLKVTIGYESYKELVYPQVYVSVYDINNRGIFALDSTVVGGIPEVLPPKGTLTCITDPINLTPGSCYANVGITKAGELADRIENAISFEVQPNAAQEAGIGHDRSWMLCTLKHKWFYSSDH